MAPLLQEGPLAHTHVHMRFSCFLPPTEPGDCARRRAAVCLHAGDDAPARAFGKDSGGQRRGGESAYGAHEALGRAWDHERNVEPYGGKRYPIGWAAMFHLGEMSSVGSIGVP